MLRNDEKRFVSYRQVLGRVQLDKETCCRQCFIAQNGFVRLRTETEISNKIIMTTYLIATRLLRRFALYLSKRTSNCLYHHILYIFYQNHSDSCNLDRVALYTMLFAVLLLNTNIVYLSLVFASEVNSTLRAL